MKDLAETTAVVCSEASKLFTQTTEKPTAAFSKVKEAPSVEWQSNVCVRERCFDPSFPSQWHCCFRVYCLECLMKHCRSSPISCTPFNFLVRTCLAAAALASLCIKRILLSGVLRFLNSSQTRLASISTNTIYTRILTMLRNLNTLPLGAGVEVAIKGMRVVRETRSANSFICLKGKGNSFSALNPIAAHAACSYDRIL